MWSLAIVCCALGYLFGSFPAGYFAGRLAGWLLRLLYRVRYTDMCAFRAIRRDALARLGMKEQTYGWNLEMQMKAARAKLRILEVPVNHRCRRGGVSKISGTLRGTFVAGTRIMTTLLRIATERDAARVSPADGHTLKT